MAPNICNMGTIYTVFQDVFGKRGYLAMLCAVFSIPVFALLAFSSVYPLVATLCFGVTYSVAAVSMCVQEHSLLDTM